GFNYRAVTAWVAGSVFGVLTVTTSLYVGPLANIAGGVDLSFIGSAVVGGVIYLLLRAVFPEQSLIAAAAQD
ncbi:MAG: purine/cytosine permease, partial [Actinobacteria bacterium]|nr:purine/cytosine permease [Actinomycetota bacterium]